MTRINPTDVDAAANAISRVADEGLCKLRKLHGPKRKYRTAVPREWDLVIEPLRQIFLELAGGRLPWPLFLHGDPRMGKTRAALAFCDRVEWARYWTVNDILDAARGRSIELLPWHCWRVELAVLDELGLPRAGEAGADFDYSMVMEFYEWRECRPAIYVSNLDLETIQGMYDSRLGWRLASGTEYHVKYLHPALVDRDRRKR